MALINCPECGKKISDKSKICIHCGYPIENEKNTMCIVNGTQYDLEFILTGSRVQSANTFSKLVGTYFEQALPIVMGIKETGIIPKTLTVKTKEQSSTQNNTPKCPTCGSTNIEKISTTSKVVGGALFGLFSSNVRNTMRCKHCGYKW